MSFIKKVFSGLAIALGPLCFLGAKQIVSLSPVITSMILNVGEQVHLIGCTKYCGVSGVSTVGGVVQPSLEAIIELSPDLILASDLTDKTLLNALDRLGFCLEVYDCSSLQGYYNLMEGLKRHFPNAITRGMRDKWNEALMVSSDYSNRRRILFLYDPVELYSCSDGSFIYDIICRLGGDPCTRGLESAWPKLSYEYVLVQDPDCLIIVGDEKDGVSIIPPRLEVLQAVHNEQVYMVSAKGCFTMGDDCLEWVGQLKALLHP